MKRNPNMFEIRDMILADREAVMAMVQAFYRSPAVEHEMPVEILERSFADATEGGDPILRGLLLLENHIPVGYCYVTEYYSAEVGGRCLMIEELYFKPQCRGKGYGSRVFDWLMKHYPEHVRLRLEVTQANSGAVRLYERLGFRFLQYSQMVLDRK